MDMHWAVNAALVAAVPADSGVACKGLASNYGSYGAPAKDVIDVDTEVPTDSEHSDSSETSLAAVPPPPPPLRSDDWTVSSNVAYEAGASGAKAPYWLAVVDGRLQVVQAAGMVKIPVPETTLPLPKPMRHSAYSEGAIEKRSPVRPPGLFIGSPPGLPAPQAAVQQPSKPKAGTKPLDSKTPPRTRTVTENSVVWVVDARKLKSTDKVIVSPRFEFATAEGPAPFRVLVYPKEVSYRTGSVSFKRSRGLCTIQLKSETSVSGDVAIDVRVGQSGCRANSKESEVVHDFSEAAVCRLPDIFNFGKEIDAETATVEIYVSMKQR